MVGWLGGSLVGCRCFWSFVCFLFSCLLGSFFVYQYFVVLVGWFADWSVGWLVGRVVGCCLFWLFICLAHCLVHCLVVSLFGWLLGRQVGSTIGCLVDRVYIELVDWLFACWPSVLSTWFLLLLFRHLIGRLFHGCSLGWSPVGLVVELVGRLLLVRLQVHSCLVLGVG